MSKLVVLFGSSALLFALVDLVHGQHNGDVHRTYIHSAEFVPLVLFLGVLVLQGHRYLTGRLELQGWPATVCLSVASLVLGLTIFGLAGGSLHGDGGPISFSFGLLACIGLLGIPVSLAGWLVARIFRKRRA